MIIRRSDVSGLRSSKGIAEKACKNIVTAAVEKKLTQRKEMDETNLDHFATEAGRIPDLESGVGDLQEYKPGTGDSGL